VENYCLNLLACPAAAGCVSYAIGGVSRFANIRSTFWRTIFLAFWR